MRGRIGTWLAAGVALSLLAGGGVAEARSKAAPVVRWALAPASSSSAPLDDSTMLTLAVVDPFSHGTLYIGRRRSLDGGATFARSPFAAGSSFLLFGISPYDLPIHALRAIGPDAACVEAGDDRYPFTTLVTTDGGMTWRNGPWCGSDAITGPAEMLEVDLSSGAGLLRRSEDGGTTWSDTATPLPAGIAALAGDPSQLRSVYAIQDGTGGDPWSFHSADDGATWTPIEQPAGIDVDGFVGEFADPVRPGTIVLEDDRHVWLSKDSGTSWTVEPGRPASPLAGFDAAGTLYALSPSPLSSIDDGISWTWHPHGLNGAVGQRVSIDRHTGAIGMQSDAGLLRLDRKGTGWRSISPYGTGVGMVPVGRPTVYDRTTVTGTRDARFMIPQLGTGLEVLDRGARHRRSAPALARIVFDHVATTPGRPRLAVAIGSDGSGPRAFVTHDAGKTWTPLRSPVAVYCTTTDAALTPGGRLVWLFGSQPVNAACPSVSAVSTRLS
jgi:hypothetical protein